MGHQQPKADHKVALGEIQEEREFINYKDSCLSSLLPLEDDAENRFRNMKEARREKVLVNTVDAFSELNHLDKIDLLKVDTQGFDLNVLKGAHTSLKSRKIQNVLVEINFVKMYSGQASPFEIIHFLGEHDLRLVDYYEKCRVGFHLGWCSALFSLK